MKQTRLDPRQTDEEPQSASQHDTAEVSTASLSPELSPHTILSLQKSIGNQAVMRMMRRGPGGKKGGGGGKKGRRGEGKEPEEESNPDGIPRGQAVPDSVMTHIMEGDTSTDPHTGYHSQSEVTPTEFIETRAPDGNGVYAGKARLGENTEFKGSTFFPTGWDRERIADEILYAYFHGRTNSWTGVSWVGRSRTGLSIGGLGVSQDKDNRTNISGIVTAFPAYDGGFLSKEEAETSPEDENTGGRGRRGGGGGKKGKKR